MENLDKITIGSFQKFKLAYEKEKTKYASYFKNIEYITDQIKEVDYKIINFLQNSIDRSNGVERLDEVLEDTNSAIYIEAGIFEFAIIYCSIKEITQNLIPSVYVDKLEELLENIKNIKSLKKKIRSKEINLQEIAFLSPIELNPKGWINIERKNKLREYKKNNMAATDLYKCYECGERKCQIMQLQTRSADEPMTNFITCLVCYNTWKK